MNVRRTSLIIVLALALAACAAPIQAPPIRPQQPSAQEALPFVTERQQGQLPAVTAPEVTLPDVFVPEITAPAVTAKPELPGMDDLAQVFPWVKVEQPKAATHSIDARAGVVPPEVRADIARFVGAKQFVAEVNQATLPTAIQRDQWWVDETTPQTPVSYVDTVRYMMEQSTAQEPVVERGEAYVDTVQYLMLNH